MSPIEHGPGVDMKASDGVVYDTREWRVGQHYGVHVYAVNPGGEDDPIASFLGLPETARRLAEQMVREHAAYLRREGGRAATARAWDAPPMPG